MNNVCYKVPPQHFADKWQLFLDERLCARVHEAALLVAQRMSDPDFVYRTAEEARRQSTYPVGWSPLSLGSGDVGLALMYEYMDRCFPDQGWDRLTRQYLRTAAQGTQQTSYGFPSLLLGTSGMVLTLSLIAQREKRYQKALVQTSQGLSRQVEERTWCQSSSEEGVVDRDYDIISGAAGILAALVTLEAPDEDVQAAIGELLTYLLWLGEPAQPVGKERWFIPPRLLPTEEHRQVAPQGHFNCGIAHGIPGPLAALALAWLAGYRYPGLRETIAYLAGWIVEHQVNAPWGGDWPDCVPLESACDPERWRSLPPTRIAWCYGAPGVARSLWLAGQALDDEPLRQQALQAIETALRRLTTGGHIVSPHLCHGIAGLLQICLRFANECDSALIRESIPALVERVLNHYNPDFVLGFRNMDQGIAVDHPGWLTGAPGIAMALLAASTPLIPAWDRVLLIA